MLEGRPKLRREVQTLSVAIHALGQSRLVDRYLVLLQPGDLVRVDVDAPHLAAELGKAGGSDQTDVSGADDRDRFTL